MVCAKTSAGAPVYQTPFGERDQPIDDEADHSYEGHADVHGRDAEKRRRIHDQVAQPLLRGNEFSRDHDGPAYRGAYADAGEDVGEGFGKDDEEKELQA